MGDGEKRFTKRQTAADQKALRNLLQRPKHISTCLEPLNMVGNRQASLQGAIDARRRQRQKAAASSLARRLTKSRHCIRQCFHPEGAPVALPLNEAQRLALECSKNSQ